MALLPGSPAIDAGDNADAPDWDQRGPGFPRIVGIIDPDNPVIDIGAFEVQQDGGSASNGAGPRPVKPVHLDLPAVLSRVIVSNQQLVCCSTSASAPPKATWPSQQMAGMDQLFALPKHGDADFTVMLVERRAQSGRDSWLADGAGRENLLEFVFQLDTLLLREAMS
jgi:hypothetical protein